MLWIQKHIFVERITCNLKTNNNWRCFLKTAYRYSLRQRKKSIRRVKLRDTLSLKLLVKYHWKDKLLKLLLSRCEVLGTLRWNEIPREISISYLPSWVIKNLKNEPRSLSYQQKNLKEPRFLAACAPTITKCHGTSSLISPFNNNRCRSISLILAETFEGSQTSSSHSLNIKPTRNEKSAIWIAFFIHGRRRHQRQGLFALNPTASFNKNTKRKTC